jgi:hypothetical protein
MAIGSQGENWSQFDDSKMIESHYLEPPELPPLLHICSVYQSFLSLRKLKKNSSYVQFRK